MAQGLYRVPKLHGAVRLIAHYAILALAFYLCFLLPASMTASQVLIGLFAFTVIYAIVMGVAAFFRARFRANAEQEAPYASQFKKNR